MYEIPNITETGEGRYQKRYLQIVVTVIMQKLQGGAMELGLREAEAVNWAGRVCVEGKRSSDDKCLRLEL